MSLRDLNEGDTLDAALEYAHRGWGVIPLHGIEDGQCSCRRPDKCSGPGKHPISRNIGPTRASTDAKQIREWWDKWPWANIGLITGWPGPGVVIDVDDQAAPKKLARPLPKTLTQTTGKGWHLFYSLPDGVEIGNSRGALPKGIDVRGGTNAYVVASPSLHASGSQYRWIERPVVELPEWLLALIRNETAPPGPQISFDPSTVHERERVSIDERVARWLDSRAPAIQGSGGGDQTFVTAMHVARGFELGPQRAAAAMAGWNQRCVPPWSPKALLRKCTEAYNKGGMPLGAKLGELTSYEAVSPGPKISPAKEAKPGAGWPAPMELRAQGAPPPFPTSSLPYWIDEWADAVSVSTQTPVELAGMLGMVAASAALMKKVELEVKPGWVEQAQLWVIAAMEASSRKSPVFDQAIKPILEWEKEQRDAMSHDVAMAAHTLEVEEGRLRALKSKLIKASNRAEQMDLADQVERQQRLIDGLESPRAEQLVADDVTMEQLVKLMAENGGKIALLSDEGGIFATAAGRYSGHVSVDALLKGYSAGRIRQERIGRGTQFVEKACLALGLAVQPIVIQEAFQNSAMRDRGLMARPIYVVPPSNVGTRESGFATRPVGDAIAGQYRAGLLSLLGMAAGDAPTRLTLSEGALAMVTEWDRALEPRMGPTGDLQRLRTWAGKLSGAICRMALILQVSDFGLDSTEVSIESMRRAIDIGGWALGHARIAFESMGDADASLTDLAIGVVQWLSAKELGGKVLRQREVYQRLRRRFVTKEECVRVLSLLVEAGWAREIADGRAVAYMINPQVCTLCTKCVHPRTHFSPYGTGA